MYWYILPLFSHPILFCQMLSPTPEGELVGKAQVKMIFDIGKVGKISGCGVIQGSMIKAASLVRVMRGDNILHNGPVKTLKSFKEDVNEVKEGFDCGINLHGWDGMEVGDVLECYVGTAGSGSSGGSGSDGEPKTTAVKTKKRKKRRKT